MVVIPYEVYKILEDELGKGKAEKVGKTIEEVLTLIEKKALEQKPILKAEIKDELTKELATKTDIAETKAEVERTKAEVEKVRAEVEKVRAELKQEIVEMRAELKLEIEKVKLEIRFIKVLFLILTGLILFINRE